MWNFFRGLKYNVKSNIIDRAEMQHSLIMVAGLSVFSLLSLGAIVPVVTEESNITSECLSEYSSVFETEEDSNCDAGINAVDKDRVIIPVNDDNSDNFTDEYNKEDNPENSQVLPSQQESDDNDSPEEDKEQSKTEAIIDIILEIVDEAMSDEDDEEEILEEETIVPPASNTEKYIVVVNKPVETGNNGNGKDNGNNGNNGNKGNKGCNSQKAFKDPPKGKSVNRNFRGFYTCFIPYPPEAFDDWDLFYANRDATVDLSENRYHIKYFNKVERDKDAKTREQYCDEMGGIMVTEPGPTHDGFYTNECVIYTL